MKKVKKPKKVKKSNKSKKAVLLLIVIIGSIFLYSLFIEPNLLVVNKYEIDAPEEIQKMRIVVFSDTHFGKSYNTEKIEKIVSKINKEEPDVVIFVGDLFDNYYRDSELIDLEILEKNLSNVEAKYAKIGISGNHDIGGGAVRVYEDLMARSGFSVLSNEVIKVNDEDIEVSGFSDMFLGETDKDFYNINIDKYSIILSHEPDIVDDVVSETDALMISGHTHGGQVNLPVITNYTLPLGGKKYKNGLFENVSVNNNIDLIVTKGIGTTVYPLRFRSVPEIMVIELK